MSNRATYFKRRAKFKRVNYDLHTVLGFYSLTIALTLTITGLIMGFQWFNKGFYWLASDGQRPQWYERAFSDTTQNLPLAGPGRKISNDDLKNVKQGG
jgi:uncharacterized iron-regulated membrane protein